MKHFGVDTDDKTSLTQAEFDKTAAELPKSNEFCSRDRRSENAIRKGQRVVQALVNGHIALD
jgi:hypothetical protein